MNRKVLVLIAILIIIGLAMMTGCGKEETDEPVTVVCLFGDHNCSKELPVNDVDTYNLILQIMDTEKGGRFFEIEIDGRPYEVAGGNISVIQSSYSERRKDSLKAKNVAAIYEGFNLAVPKTPEVDVLKALIMAGERASASEAKAEIVIIDNGIPTTGEIDGKTMFTADPKWLVERLKERNCIPKLEGAEVFWIGIGDLSAGEQEPLSESCKSALKKQWKAIIEAGGGEVEFISAFRLQERQDGYHLPEVTPVDVPNSAPIYYEDEGSVDLTNATIITEDKLLFLPKTAELADESIGKGVIKDIANYMKRNPDKSILVGGSIAGEVESDGGSGLSQMRAETVKKMLVKDGVDPSRIKAIGLGIHSPWRIDGLGIGPEAAPNRHVVVVDLESDIAQELLLQQTERRQE